jgi:polar amino acid transport system substrate-binding protein
MNKYSICIVLLIICFYKISSGAEKILLATGEWTPYTSESMTGYGLITEIVTAAFKEVDIEPSYRFLPWKRAETELENGDVFGIFPYILTHERKKKYNFSEVLTDSKGYLFYYIPSKKINRDFNWKTFSDLKKYKTGGTIGYWYEKPFKDSGLDVDYSVSDEQGIKKLKYGRIDILASEERVGWQLIHKLFPEDIEKFGVVKKPLNKDELRVMISRNYPDSHKIMMKLNAGIKKIKANGKLKKILQSHGIRN